jgi:hypothetical protein
MESIIIHTETKEQTKAFEQMAKAMDLEFNTDKAVNNISFKEEFSKAIDIEMAEKIAIKNVKKAWKKLR